MRKLQIAEEEIQVNNMKAAARKYKVFSSQIDKWEEIILILREHSEISSKKLKLHREKLENP